MMNTFSGAMNLADAIRSVSLDPPENAEERNSLYRAALQLVSTVEAPFDTLNRLTFAVSNAL